MEVAPEPPPVHSSMRTSSLIKLALICGLATVPFVAPAASAQIPATAPKPAATREVVLLYTNDFHTALRPIGAYWLPGAPRIGGAAALAGYVNRYRVENRTTFLFDSGDMFTGLVSNLTRGEALMEMMRAMRYDAMGIGNHEFDYGSDAFETQMNRVPFPVLGANIFYKGTRHRFSRPWVILERNGVRIGVIGIIGQDARSVANQAGITGLDFEDPATAIAPIVAELRPQVDLIVVLAHQGKTGPQQTDAEAHPDLQRDFDEDIRLAGAVPGIDVLLGGHAHRGIETPFVHPKTGTIITQTYGYGTRLGVLRLTLRDHKVVAHRGELVKTWSDRVTPDPAVAAVVARYERQIAPQVGTPLFTLARRVYRAYNAESPLGNLVADAMRDATGAELAMENAGGLRADLPDGPLTTGHVLDVLPFLNTLDTYRATGAQILAILEQSATLERGMMQVSGLRAEYDLSRPAGSRIGRVWIGGQELDPARSYVVASNSFIGAGGDLYATFPKTERLTAGAPLSEVLVAYLRKVSPATVAPPTPFVPGRLIPTKR